MSRYCGNSPAFVAAIVSAWLLSLCPDSVATLAIDSATTNWIPIIYGNNNVPDPLADQQTGSSEGDLVGDAVHPSFYTQFDDLDDAVTTNGTLAFRIRAGRDKNPSGFSTAAFVGIDATTNGVLDLFVGVDNSGSGDKIAIWYPGSGENTSPSTTSLSNPSNIYTQTTLNYDWSPVTSVIDPDAISFDLDGNGADYFLSFSVPFDDVVLALALGGITADEDTPFTYVMATATQDNSLNQDLNGVDGGVNSDQTWSQLGAVTEVYSASGTQLTPEPATFLLILLGGVCCRTAGRRRGASRH